MKMLPGIVRRLVFRQSYRAHIRREQDEFLRVQAQRDRDLLDEALTEWESEVIESGYPAPDRIAEIRAELDGTQSEPTDRTGNDHG